MIYVKVTLFWKVRGLGKTGNKQGKVLEKLKKKKRLFVWCKENSKVREWLYPKAAFWVEVSGRNIRAFSEDMTFEQENKRQDRHHYRKISEMRATVRYQRKNKLGMLKEKETMWVEHNEKEKSYDE